VACEDALSAYVARHAFHDLRLQAMAVDNSWRSSAQRYVDEVYRRAGAR